MQHPRVIIADDHKMVAELFREVLSPEFDVIAMVEDGQELVTAAARLKPDIVLADISMPILNGLDAGQRVKEVSPTTKVIIVTMNPDPEIAAEAFHRGISGYVVKTSDATELVNALKDVLRGRTYLSSGISRDDVAVLRWQNKKFVQEEQRLTPRQIEVLELLVQGRRMKEIGVRLNLSARTVAFHKYRIMEVLGAKSNADLIKYAVRNHIAGA
ncbi:MAG TPA: response regulator transcription factor [Terracidiphilus sp.]